MEKRILIASIAITALAASALGQGKALFSKGSVELGGSFLFSRATDYGVFDQAATEADRGGYTDTIQAGVNIGIFPIDRLSIVLTPSIFMFRNHSLDDVPIFGIQESYEGDMTITFDFGSRYYLATRSSLAFSLGADLGFGTTFGLKQVDHDVIIDNKHTYVHVSFEPKAAAYYFISASAAPYAELGYKFAFAKKTKNDDGSDYDPGSGWSVWEDVRGRLNVGLGVKFFIPAPGRFGEVQRRDINDMIDDGVIFK